MGKTPSSVTVGVPSGKATIGTIEGRAPRDLHVYMDDGRELFGVCAVSYEAGVDRCGTVTLTVRADPSCNIAVGGEKSE